MNVIPTLEGGLRIDAECDVDWRLLLAVVEDATSGEKDLAARLGIQMDDDPHAEDWQEYVVPDLRDGFQDQLDQVAAAILNARNSATDDGGSLWIHRKDGMLWFGALNQARLALEDRYQFGPRTDFDAAEFDEFQRSAFMRSRFYQVVQSLLLDYVIV